MPTIAEIRAKYPQYADLSDDELLTKLHGKFYSDMPYEAFRAKVGGVPAPSAPAPAPAVASPKPEGPKGWADWRQIPARLWQGTVDIGSAFEGGAAKIDELLGQDPTRSRKRQAMLRGRAQLIEDLVPRPESTVGGIGADIVQDVPALLAGEALFAAAAPARIKKALEITKGMRIGSRAVRRAGRGAGSGLGFSIASGEALEDPSKLLTTPAQFAAMDVGFGSAGDVLKSAFRPPELPLRRPVPNEVMPPLDIPELSAEQALAVRDALGIRIEDLPEPIRGLGRDQPWARRRRPSVEPPGGASEHQVVKPGELVVPEVVRPTDVAPKSEGARAVEALQKRVEQEPGLLPSQAGGPRLQGGKTLPEGTRYDNPRPNLPFKTTGKKNTGQGGYSLQDLLFPFARGAVGGVVGAPVGAALNPENPKAGALAGFGTGVTLGVGSAAIASRAVARRAATKALPDFSQRIQRRIAGDAKSARKPISELLEDVYAGLVSTTQRLRRADKAAGAGVPVEKSVFAAGRATQGSARRAQGFMTYGPRRYVNGNWEATGTPGLEQVSQMAGRDVEALSRYQLAARTLELLRVGSATRRRVVTGIDPADAAAEVAANPQLAAAHKAAVAFDRDILNYWADAGGASPEGVAAMEALGQDYVHLGRVFESAKRPGTRIGNVAQQLQPLRGSEREILDPWLSRVDRTARMVRAADRQRVVLNLVEMAESKPQEFAGLVRRVGEKKGAVMTEEAGRIQAAAAKAGHEIDDDVATQLSEAMSDRALSKDNRISVWRNGRRETWELDPSLATAISGLGPQEVSWFSRMMGGVTGVFKGGVTLDPTFGIFNAFRDGLDASVQSRHGFRLGLDSFRGFHEAVRANWLGQPRKVYEDFVASGGGFSTLRGSGTKGSGRVAEELAKGEASGKRVPLADVVKHPLEALKRFALPFEEAARIGEFMRAKGAGAKDIAAFMAQQDVTVNFQEVGTVMRGLNMQVPFLNPAIQSLDRAAKTLGDPLIGLAKGREGAGQEAARVYGTAIATIALPSILFWAASADDQEIKDLRKTNAGLIYWFLRSPNGEVIRLPKPFLYGQIFGTGTEAVLDRMFDDDPEAMGRWAHGIQEQSVSTSLPMWAQIPSDLRSNESAFFKTPIVPQGKEGLEPRLQSGPQTSTIAKKFGEATNISPAKAEYVFNQVTGTLGRRGLDLADRAVEGVSGEPPRPRESADNPIYGRFFARTSTTNKEPVRGFYDKMADLEKLSRTFKADEADRPEQLEERYPPEVMRRLELLPEYRAVARELRDLRAQLDEVLASDMDMDAKKAYQKQVYDQIVELTRNLNTVARNAAGR